MIYLLITCAIVWIALGVVGNYWGRQWLVYEVKVMCGEDYKFSTWENIIDGLCILGGIATFLAGLHLYCDYKKLKKYGWTRRPSIFK